MRNSEAQRYARWSAAVAALLALILAGVYLRNVWLVRQAEKKAPPAVPASVEQRSNEFSYSKVDGKQTIFTVRASRATEFKKDSRDLLEDVAISVYGKKGERNDTLRTSACDFITSTGKISCAGAVQIRLEASGVPPASANSIQVATSGVTFDRNSGEARTGQAVTFHWPDGQGRAVGVRYDSSSGTLYLEHDVELNITASPSGPAEKSKAKNNLAKNDRATKTQAIPENAPDKTLRLTSDTMAFQREARTVQMQGNVQARQATHDLFADNLLLELDPALHARRLTASGHPRVLEEDPYGPIALSADEMDAELKPDGSIESIVATGSVHGTRTTPAGQDVIDAGRIQMLLATGRNAPQLLTAGNGVTLTSTSAAANGGTRRVESDVLEIHFSQASRQGQTLVTSVNTLAPARAEWQDVAMVNGKGVPQTMRMSGNRMNLRFDGQNRLRDLVATGGVEVARKIGDAPEQTTASRELTAKFSNRSSNAGEWSTIDQTGGVRFQDGPRTGQADHAHADRTSNTVTLGGSVVLSDAMTRTTAQTATFAQGSNTLRADGHVQTTELGAASGSISNFAQEPAHVSADHLVADTARGRAVYSGDGRLWQGQSVIQADAIELDSASHMVVAKGHVRGVFPQAAWSPRTGPTAMQTTGQSAGQSGRPAPQLGHVQAGMLTYWEAQSSARIEQGARVDSQQGSIQANRIDLFFSDSGGANTPKQLSRAVATGQVSVRQQDRRGTSNRAEYTASEGKFVLSEGNPTLYSSSGDMTTGRQLTFYFADDRIVVDSAEGTKTVTLHRVEK
ncbi:MAG TPA: LPS export ABC transporter periplasmic protein LptC [Candidatus Dormibacteraeota bacterium]|nr:LPS export ABC transporter periplasmic protein LptC [Candidatus Dormibacteraeota bacterium]